MTKVDVCIRGGGAVGLSLALALARQGLQLGLAGGPASAAPAQPDVRAYALNAASRALLQSLPCPVSIGEQRDYGDGYRYVAVGE